jgi:hypothetical protein
MGYLVVLGLKIGGSVLIIYNFRTFRTNSNQAKFLGVIKNSGAI